MAMPGLLVVGGLCTYLWRAGFWSLDKGTSRAVIIVVGMVFVVASMATREASPFSTASAAVNALSNLEKLTPQQSALLEWLTALGDVAEPAFQMSGPFGASCDWCAQEAPKRGVVAVLRSLQAYILVWRLLPYASATVAVAAAAVLSPHAAAWRGMTYLGLLGAFSSDIIALLVLNVPFRGRELLAKVPTAILFGYAALTVTEAKFLAGSRPGNDAAVAIAKCNTLLMSRLGTIGATALTGPVVMGDGALASKAYTYWQQRQQSQARTWEQINETSPPSPDDLQAAEDGVHALYNSGGKPIAVTVAGQTYMNTRELMGF